MQIILDNQTGLQQPDINKLQRVAEYILTQQQHPTDIISVGVFIVDSATIRQINNDYRHKDKSTDVISFRLIDNPNFVPITSENFPIDYDCDTNTIYLGEIFICQQIAEEQALEYNHSLEREVLELFSHGMLHLLGYDHETDAEREIMHQYELDIVNNLDKIITKAR